MNRFVSIVSLLFLAFGIPLVEADEPARSDFSSDQLITKIAFGSCSKQDEPQPIWSAIVDRKPDLFVYMGDNVYGDTEDMNVLQRKWNQQKNIPGYQQLRGICRVLGTWDDHDFGRNDAGREYPLKAESQQLFLDFLDEPDDSLRRTRKGVYASYVYGPASRRVQLILLDTRSFRSPLKKEKNTSVKAEGITGPYVNDYETDGEMLGHEQWDWLEQQLKVPAQVRLIVSSIQVLPDEHGWEKWANLYPERERLLKLLNQPHVNGVILLSGDRHASEFSRLQRDANYDLWELTCSSLNRPREFVNEINQYRVGLMYSDVNFGMLNINWDRADPELTLQICDLSGKTMLQVRTDLSDLNHD